MTQDRPRIERLGRSAGEELRQKRVGGGERVGAWKKRVGVSAWGVLAFAGVQLGLPVAVIV